MINEYTDHYWTIDDYGRVRIYGGLAEGPTAHHTAMSSKPVVGVERDRVRGVLTLTTSNYEIWEVSSQIAATTPPSSWRGVVERERQLERKADLKQGRLDVPLHRRVLFVGEGTLPERAVYQLRDMLDAQVYGCAGVDPEWDYGPVDAAVVANGELLERLAERYDAIAGEIPMVAIEAMAQKARRLDVPIGPAGKPMRLYAIVHRGDGKHRWARVG